MPRYLLARFYPALAAELENNCDPVGAISPPGCVDVVANDLNVSWLIQRLASSVIWFTSVGFGVIFASQFHLSAAALKALFSWERGQIHTVGTRDTPDGWVRQRMLFVQF
jgi:hypothetical protein